MLLLLIPEGSLCRVWMGKLGSGEGARARGSGCAGWDWHPLLQVVVRADPLLRGSLDPSSARDTEKLASGLRRSYVADRFPSIKHPTASRTPTENRAVTAVFVSR